VSLAIKVVPFPDFGVDEVVLVVVSLVLVIVYRPALRAILEETRAVEAASVGSARKAARKGEGSMSHNAQAIRSPNTGKEASGAAAASVDRLRKHCPATC
jgi:hypothetical protein